MHSVRGIKTLRTWKQKKTRKNNTVHDDHAPNVARRMY